LGFGYYRAMDKSVLIFHPPTDLGYSILTPLGLAMIHASTPEGYRAEVRDATTERWSSLSLASFAPYDVIGVSARFTYEQKRVKSFLRDLTKRYPEKVIIAGGNHASYDAEGMLASGAHYVVRNMGEQTWAELLCALRDGKSAAGIAGLTCRDGKNGTTCVGADRPFVSPDVLPFPSFQVFRPRDYPYTMGMFGAMIEASRGCPNHCHFCTNPAVWRGKWASKSIDRIVAEVDRLAELGFTFASFADDNFGADRENLNELLTALARRRPVMPFMAEMQPRMVARDPAMLDLAWKAGMRFISLDTNTTDPEMIGFYERPDSPETIREALDAVRRSRLASVSNVIVGAPGQSLASMRHDIRFAQAHADVFSCGTVEPRPGNRFWRDEYFAMTDQMCKGEALLHESPELVRRLIHRALLGYYLDPRQWLRGLFSAKPGVRILFRLQFRLYANAARRKFIDRWIGKP
jgi:radical SAM superfamily enzyme YgiQ (UPF0313 family)